MIKCIQVKIMVFAAVSILMLSQIAIPQSFGSTSEVFWELVYVKNSTCLNLDNEKMQNYVAMTSKYLEQYQLENTSLGSHCMKQQEFEEFSFNENSQLKIVIYDEKLGIEFLQLYNLDGFYLFLGNDSSKNHLVVVCDCSENKISAETALTPWILSHELSHFVLSYKGYNKYSIEGIVHQVDDRYADCTVSIVNQNCDNVTITIRPDDVGRDFEVMAPYVPAIGNQLTKHVPENLNSDEINEKRSATHSWVSGQITDEEYANAIIKLINGQKLKGISDSSILEIENGFIIPEEMKNFEQNLVVSNLIEENLKELAYTMSGKLSEIEYDEQTITFPNWFKTRALLWSEERISDQIFFEGLDHLIRKGNIHI